jgi:hypothetical protein
MMLCVPLGNDLLRRSCSSTGIRVGYVVCQRATRNARSIKCRPVTTDTNAGSLGLMIYMQWPSSSAWAIGTLVGISTIISGATRVMLSLAARKAVTAIA